MKAKRELPRTPLALAVMNLLMERPMHPYEMKSTMKERGHDQVIRLKGGSIYDTVERLEAGGVFKKQEREPGGRPASPNGQAPNPGGAGGDNRRAGRPAAPPRGREPPIAPAPPLT